VAIKRKVCGDRNRGHFKAVIHLFCGGLDLYSSNLSQGLPTGNPEGPGLKTPYFIPTFKVNILLRLIFIGFLLFGCSKVNFHGKHANLEEVLCRLDSSADYSELPLISPLESSIYPPEISSPLFSWQGPAQGFWIIRIFKDSSSESLYFSSEKNPWEPAPSEWNEIKELSPGSDLHLEVSEIHGNKITLKSKSGFKVSKDPLNANIVYQEIPVPFSHASKNTKKFRWRVFDPKSYTEPPVILQGLPYCANCHFFSRDGKTFGLDVDYRGDRGGYMLSPVRSRMELRDETVISWNDYRPSDPPQSRGLFAKISPLGDYVIASVEERPFLIRIEDPAYSQLFFPLSGHLAYYSTRDGDFHPLPGADDTSVIQINPAWNHDGKTIAFARGQSSEFLWKTLGDKKFLDAAVGEDIHTLSEKYTMRFDLWTIPFNDGKGGKASPLPGASGNGLSNYFPRYTPDGKWLVYCQAQTGLVSLPDSRLAIIPASGGEPRIMKCNRQELNSWHSFSPNGRWMVFSSKPDGSSLTRVFLSHIDEYGNDSPAIQLHRIGSPGMAAILPEAVVQDSSVIKKIVFIE